MADSKVFAAEVGFSAGSVPGATVPQLVNNKPVTNSRGTAPQAAFSFSSSDASMPMFPANIPIGQVLDNNLFANHILGKTYLVPTAYDFGNVVTKQVIKVRIWNAKKVNLSITNISTTAAKGLGISGNTNFPVVLPPNGEIEYTVTASPQGKPKIDDTITWNTDDRTMVLHVIGSRVIIYSLPPQTDLKEVLSFKTKIIKTLDAKEQRIALRTKPQHSLQYEPITNEEATAHLSRQLYGWGFRDFAVPMWNEALRYEGTIDTVQTEILVPTTDRRYKVGELIMAWKNPMEHEAAQISKVEDGKVTIVQAFKKAWERPLVMPLCFGLMDERVTIDRRKVGAASHKVSFTMKDHLEIPAAQPYDTYDGLPVYDKPLTFRGSTVKESYSQNNDVINFGILTEQREEKYDTPDVANELLVILYGWDAIMEFKKFCMHLKGMQKPFYLVTWRNEFEWVGNVSSSAIQIRVKAANVGTYYLNSGTRSILAIQRKSDGKWFFTKIVDAIQDTFGGRSVDLLTVDQALGWDANEDDVQRVSLLLPVRLGTDDIIFDWTNNTEAVLKLPVLEVKP